jgi:GT2 family glycosyltransferase/glycosyltransferase involved in cell wall biosynthesis
MSDRYDLGRRALIVLGMHRSGTSLGAAMLSCAGADAPRNVSGAAMADGDNETGYWEPWHLPLMHDELLREMGVSWSSPLRYPEGFFRSSKANRFAERAREILREEYDESALFCLKEPRLCRLLPLWKPVFEREGVDPSYVLISRNPIEVARSLERRNGFHWSEASMAWLRHVLEAEQQTRGSKRVFITYDQLMEDWRSVLHRIGKRLDIEWPRRMSDIDVEFSAIINDRFRHHRSQNVTNASQDVPAWVVDIDRACSQAAQGNELEQLDVFDRVRKELEVADKAFEPLLVLQNRNAGRAIEERDKREQEIRGELDLARAGLVAAEDRASQLEAEISTARNELESWRRDREALLRELEVSQSVSVSARDEATNLALRVAEIESQVAAAQAEVTKSRSERDVMLGELEESQSLTAGARDEATRLALQVAEREGRCSELEAAAIASTTELASLRGALESQRDEVAERDAQVADLRDKLTSARTGLSELAQQVGAFEASAATDRAKAAKLARDFEESNARYEELQSEIAFVRREAGERQAALTSAKALLAAQSAKTALSNAAAALTIEEQAEATSQSIAEMDELRAATRRYEDRIEALESRLLESRTAAEAEREKLDAAKLALAAEKKESRAATAELEVARASEAAAYEQLALRASDMQPLGPTDASVRNSKALTRKRPPAQLIPSDASRYGAHFPDAMRAAGNREDYVWLGVIDFDFRIQRPQHLAMEIADAGHRVFYLSIQFDAAEGNPHFRIDKMPHPNVFILRLGIAGPVPENIYGGFSDAQVVAIAASLDQALRVLAVVEPIVVVQYPSWYKVAAGVPGAVVVHDCLDYVGGFSNVPPAMIDLEAELIRNADVVVTTSRPLSQQVGEFRENVIVRNAADVDLFARAAVAAPRIAGRRPTIGYFGAIAEWFEVDWIERCAKARPDWDFALIGHTGGADVSALADLPNVRLLGEQPYLELPRFLADFDVAIIPFKINELTRCTNPVKLYEYMAAGKPVVASPMPEVVEATPLVYIARDSEEFEKQIDAALREDTPALRSERANWAKTHTWKQRARDFVNAVAQAKPRVSVIVLAYNQWHLTDACLHSVLSLTDYSNLEVIVVDNASSDETPERLAEIAAHDERVRVIRNGDNLGFAGGNNVGIKAATGDYFVLLNNDTFVTKGWLRDLIRPLMQDSSIGLTGPLTNNIGNEQKIIIHYVDMQEMQLEARRFVRARLRHRYEANNLAFFCVATRRDVVENIGLLDEAYGLGFFEDDDYCQRVRAAAYRIAIVDDVFIHHHLSGSFDMLGSAEKQSQMERNKAIFENRWGPWTPHVYRDAPAFG